MIRQMLDAVVAVLERVELALSFLFLANVNANSNGSAGLVNLYRLTNDFRLSLFHDDSKMSFFFLKIFNYSLISHWKLRLRVVSHANYAF